ncbi:Erg28 like protein [Theobroma cacao]|uniref:Erg28 like protein n=1 Tax=Theobroma cacao TaxID=3641 RepID=A0A061DXY2_THECC|nr:Erg28 like protein [Theobroma cacao]
MKALGWWLMLVGSLRLVSVWLGFFNVRSLHRGVYSKSQVTEVHGRTFGIWTLLTCTLCYLCAFNLENKALCLVTFLSFVYAFVHFLTEYLIYGTTTVRNLSAVSFFAGTSIIWMLLHSGIHINLKEP